MLFLGFKILICKCTYHKTLVFLCQNCNAETLILKMQKFCKFTANSAVFSECTSRISSFLECDLTTMPKTSKINNGLLVLESDRIL